MTNAVLTAQSGMVTSRDVSHLTLEWSSGGEAADILTFPVSLWGVFLCCVHGLCLPCLPAFVLVNASIFC